MNKCTQGCGRVFDPEMVELPANFRIGNYDYHSANEPLRVPKCPHCERMYFIDPPQEVDDVEAYRELSELMRGARQAMGVQVLDTEMAVKRSAVCIGLYSWAAKRRAELFDHMPPEHQAAIMREFPAAEKLQEVAS